MVVLSNLAPPNSGVRFQQPQTSAVLENCELGPGTLYIAESCVSWRAEDGRGFSLEYPAITLHAISRDLSTYGRECLYLMVNCKPTDITGGVAGAASSSENGAGEDGNGQIGDEAEEDDDPSPLTEIRFVPTDVSVLDQMFAQMSECQALHPDEEDDDSDDPDASFYDEGFELGPAGDFQFPPSDQNEPQVCLPTGAMGVIEGGGGGEGDSGRWFTAEDQTAELNDQGRAILHRILRPADVGETSSNGANNEDESMEMDHDQNEQ